MKKKFKSKLKLERGKIEEYVESAIIPITSLNKNYSEFFSNCCFAPVVGDYFPNSNSIIREGTCSRCYEPAIFDTMENFAYN